jgi:hypothetical protein
MDAQAKEIKNKVMCEKKRKRNETKYNEAKRNEVSQNETK